MKGARAGGGGPSARGPQDRTVFVADDDGGGSDGDGTSR